MAKTKIQYLSRMRELLMANNYTAAQITKTITDEFPGVSEGGVKTVISDSKNVKYTKFKDLEVKTNEGGIFIAVLKEVAPQPAEAADSSETPEAADTIVNIQAA